MLATDFLTIEGSMRIKGDRMFESYHISFGLEDQLRKFCLSNIA